jgi:DNA-binding CsgD family transcriptional regulator
VTLPQAPPVELVQSLFDLTPAEARVARGLASGKTVDDIAIDGGTSPNTIRTHVRGVLEKTGLQPAGRHRGASHRHFLDTADAPELTSRSLRDISQKITPSHQN